MKSPLPLAIGITALFFSLNLSASQVIYPAKGQSAEQQKKDDTECQAWAKENTGIDPVALAATPVPQETGSTLGSGDRARGAARGALGGAAIGAIAGDAGKGAGIGAVTGTAVGGAQARQKQAATNQQHQAQRQQQIDTYNKAVAACMEGRGYTVK